MLAYPPPPILPNTPKPNNNPNINANNAKIPNIGHNQAGHPPFFDFLTGVDPIALYLIGLASTFDPLFDTLAGSYLCSTWNSSLIGWDWICVVITGAGVISTGLS